MKTANLILLVDPTKQQLVDYANAVAQVNNYVYSITQTSLPTLNRPPKHYSDFTIEFIPAKSHAINWTGSLFPNMLSLPQSILNAKFLFEMNKSNLKQTLEYLKQHPNDNDATNTLKSILGQMQGNIQAQIAVVEGIEDNLNAFATNIQKDAITLNDLAQKALQAATEDQDQIKLLNKHIDKLNDEIQSLSKWLVVTEIGMGLSIFIGLIGLVVAVIPGGQGAGIAIIVFAVAGEAGSIAGTVILNKMIQVDQAIIKTERQQIKELDQDIIALQAVNKQFEYLVKANQGAQNALTTIKTMWTNLDSDLGEVITDLTTIGTDTDVTQPDYGKALQDLQAADIAWQEVVTFAQALQGIVYKWQDKDGTWHDISKTPPKVDSATVTPIDNTQAA